MLPPRSPPSRTAPHDAPEERVAILFEIEIDVPAIGALEAADLAAHPHGLSHPHVAGLDLRLGESDRENDIEIVLPEFAQQVVGGAGGQAGAILTASRPS